MWKDRGLDDDIENVESDVCPGAFPAPHLRTAISQCSVLPQLSKKGDFSPRHTVLSTSEGEREQNLFPSTRYYGSKRRQLDWIRGELFAVKGHTALDAFGGTGAVSHLLRTLGWNTTYNDIFEFNTITARALFSNSTKSLSKEKLQEFLRKVEPATGLITSIFDGLYFTDEENMWLDGFMITLQEEPLEHKNLLLYCLFQACLKKRPFNLFHRANLKLRSSEMPVKFGNRTTWNRSFNDHITKTYEEVKLLQSYAPQKITVIASQCALDIPPDFDLVYLDPPYFKKSKKNTETYIERYHFLEGLARYSEWKTLIDQNSPIRSFPRSYRQEWAYKGDMLSNLCTMFKKHRGAAFALSYVADEEPTVEELFSLFQTNFDKVRISYRSFGRVLSKKKTFEILLIGQ